VDALPQVSERRHVLQVIVVVALPGPVLTEVQEADPVRINRIEVQHREVVAIDHQVVEVLVPEVAAIEVQEAVPEVLAEVIEVPVAVQEAQDRLEVPEAPHVHLGQDPLHEVAEEDNKPAKNHQEPYQKK